MEHKMVSEKRGYKVLNVDQAKTIALQNLEAIKDREFSFGLPEINDRYHIWTVPILYKEFFNIGSIVISAKTALIDSSLSTEEKLFHQRISNINKYAINNKKNAIQVVVDHLSKNKLNNETEVDLNKIKLIKKESSIEEWFVPIQNKKGFTIGEVIIFADNGKIDSSNTTSIETLSKRLDKEGTKKSKKVYNISPLDNMIIKGSSEDVLYNLPAESIDLVFTSPPYYNAKKQYSEYDNYEGYLELMRDVIRACKRVLMDGKFFVMNTSHVLIPRANRSEASTRLAVPFDLHKIFIEEGFEFIDDIIWQKPEGAGWASGRGRRFSADRNAMQYKGVPVTEYVMVYRKKSTKLIDYFIKNHPDKNIVEESKILGEYDVTNIWYIAPARDKNHPAVFPEQLAERVIKYYSFKNDVVLDPFAGTGTTARSALNLQRKFCMVETKDEYIEVMKEKLSKFECPILQSNGLYTYYNYSDVKHTTKHENKTLAQGIKLETVVRSLLKVGVEEEFIQSALDLSLLEIEQVKNSMGME